jgi:hypothetical protein
MKPTELRDVSEKLFQPVMKRVITNTIYVTHIAHNMVRRVRKI